MTNYIDPTQAYQNVIQQGGSSSEAEAAGRNATLTNANYGQVYDPGQAPPQVSSPTVTTPTPPIINLTGTVVTPDLPANLPTIPDYVAPSAQEINDLSKFSTQMFAANNAVIPIVYGRDRLFGKPVLIHIDDVGGFLYVDYAFCEGPVEGVVKVFVDGVWTDDPSNGLIIRNSTAAMNIYKGGADNIADPMLAGEITGYSDTNPGVCHIVLKIPTGATQGFPSCEAIIDGCLCYDIRKDDTATTISPPGSGTHRLNDPTTWEFTETPAICFADAMRRVGIGVSGQGIVDTANANDELVTDGALSEPRRRIGLALLVPNSLEDIIKLFRVYMGAFTPWEQGVIRCIPDMPVSGFVTAFNINYGGSASAFSAPSTSANNVGSGSFTIEIHVCVQAMPSSDAAIVAKTDSSGHDGYELLLTSDGRLKLRMQNTSHVSTSYSSDPNIIKTNLWTAVSVVVDRGANTVTFYTDGIAASPITITTTGSLTNTGGLNVGNRDGGDKPLQLIAADLRLWNIARADIDISADFDSRLTGTESNLVAYYKMDTASGDAVTDLTSNANDGQFIGRVGCGSAKLPNPGIAYHFTTDDIRRTSVRVTQRSIRKFPTAVVIEYRDNSTDVWRTARETHEAPGIGTVLPRRTSKVSLPGIHRISQAKREAYERLNSFLADFSIDGLDVFDEGLRLQIGSVVACTYGNRMSGMVFRVVGIQGSAGRYRLTLTEYDPGLYSNTVVATPPYDVTNVVSTIGVVTTGVQNNFNNQLTITTIESADPDWDFVKFLFRVENSRFKDLGKQQVPVQLVGFSSGGGGGGGSAYADWTVIDVSGAVGSSTNLYGVATSGDTIIAVGDFGNIIRSTNGGVTWSLSSYVSGTLQTNATLFDVVCLAANTWMVGGSSGNSFISTDDGVTWVTPSFTVDTIIVGQSGSVLGYRQGAFGSISSATGVLDHLLTTPSETLTLREITYNSSTSEFTIIIDGTTTPPPTNVFQYFAFNTDDVGYTKNGSVSFLSGAFSPVITTDGTLGRKWVYTWSGSPVPSFGSGNSVGIDFDRYINAARSSDDIIYMAAAYPEVGTTLAKGMAIFSNASACHYSNISESGVFTDLGNTTEGGVFSVVRYEPHNFEYVVTTNTTDLVARASADFSVDSSYLMTAGSDSDITGLGFPVDVVFDGTNYVFIGASVSDQTSGKLSFYKTSFAPGGNTIIDNAPSPAPAYQALAVDNESNVYACDFNGDIFKSSAGAYTFVDDVSGVGGVSSLWDIVRSNGTLWSRLISVGDGSTVVIKDITAPPPAPGGALTAMSPASVSSGNSPVGCAITPDGAHFYAVNQDDATVSQYSISGGALTPLGTPTVSSGAGPLYITVSPDGNYAYVSNNYDDTIGQYSIVSGVLTPLSPATVSVVSPHALRFTPDGLYAFAVKQAAPTGAIYQFTVSSGVLTPNSPATVSSGNFTTDCVISPDGNYLYAINLGGNTISQYSISSGVLTPLSPATVATGNSPQGIAISPDGAYLYVTNSVDNTVSQYSISSGLLTPLSPATVSTGSQPIGIVVSPDGNNVYVATNSGHAVYQYYVTSGKLSPLSPASLSISTSYGNFPGISPDGAHVYVTASPNLIYQYSRS